MNSTIYKKKSPLAVFLIPAFLFMAVFLYYPFAMNIYNSFCNITGLGTAAEGFNSPWYLNYGKLFQDPIMNTALVNTMLLMLLTIIFQVGIALLLALLIDNIKKGTQFFRTVYFFPIVISATALGLLFNLIFLYDGGMVNQLLMKFGMTDMIDWKDEAHFLFTMMTPVMWQYVGFYFVIIVTGLNNISPDIYEAAEIDGASGFNRVRYISLPLLHNVLITCLILAVTGALKVFDLPWVMMGAGMPMDQSWLTGTYMYNQTFTMGDVDYGSTIAIVIVVIGVVVSQVANRIFKEKDY
ncbi:sugar ABC transporter permease [Clostridium sp. KNHs216]|uniref:carbohydrate ABC transporter permease n=1 Tax=Eubacteriales TaxID=186802 RepID=UPI00114F4410|nr:sugar ABC transporter permease [Clostridium sp. KNHs216]TQI68072.1 raffinose/stachyose/melibiose transport system permease protein [Clostridium sp. KNHs216]